MRSINDYWQVLHSCQTTCNWRKSTKRRENRKVSAVIKSVALRLLFWFTLPETAVRTWQSSPGFGHRFSNICQSFSYPGWLSSTRTTSTTLTLLFPPFFYIFVCSPNKNPGQFLPIRKRKAVSEPRRLIIIRRSLKFLAKHPRIVGIDLGFESRIRLWAELKRLTSDLQLRSKHQTKLGSFTLSKKSPQLQSGLDRILWREMNDSDTAVYIFGDIMYRCEWVSFRKCSEVIWRIFIHDWFSFVLVIFHEAWRRRWFQLSGLSRVYAWSDFCRILFSFEPNPIGL